MNPIGRDETLQFLNAAMSVAKQRHTVVASNIANVDTPGYKARDIDFEGVMQETLDRLESTDPRFLELVRRRETEQGLPVEDRINPVWQQLDRNNVNLESEMAHLSQTAGTYKLATRLFQVKYRLIRDVIGSR